MAEVKEQMSAEDIVVANDEMLKNDDKNTESEYLSLIHQCEGLTRGWNWCAEMAEGRNVDIGAQ